MWNPKTNVLPFFTMSKLNNICLRLHIRQKIQCKICCFAFSRGHPFPSTITRVPTVNVHMCERAFAVRATVHTRKNAWKVWGYGFDRFFQTPLWFYYLFVSNTVRKAKQKIIAFCKCSCRCAARRHIDVQLNFDNLCNDTSICGYCTLARIRHKYIYVFLCDSPILPYV